MIESFKKLIKEKKLVGGLELENQVNKLNLVTKVLEVSKNFDKLPFNTRINSIKVLRENIFDPYLKQNIEISIVVNYGKCIENSKILGDFNKESQTIYLYLERIKEYSNNGYSITSLIKITLVHELTHLIDPTPQTNLDIDKEFLNSREINATTSSLLMMLHSNLITVSKIEKIKEALRKSDLEFIKVFNEIVNKPTVLMKWYENKPELIKQFKQRLFWYIKENQTI